MRVASPGSASNGRLVVPRFFSAAIFFLSWAMIFFRSDLGMVFHASLNAGSNAERDGLRRSASEAQFVVIFLDMMMDVDATLVESCRES